MLSALLCLVSIPLIKQRQVLVTLPDSCAVLDAPGDEVGISPPVSACVAAYGQFDFAVQNDSPLAFVGMFGDFRVFAKTHEDDLLVFTL